MAECAERQMSYHHRDENSSTSVSYRQQQYNLPNLVIKNDLDSKGVCVVLDMNAACPNCTGKFKAKIISSQAKLSVSRRGQYAQRELPAPSLRSSVPAGYLEYPQAYSQQQYAPAVYNIPPQRPTARHSQHSDSYHHTGSYPYANDVYTQNELQNMGYYQSNVPFAEQQHTAVKSPTSASPKRKHHRAEKLHQQYHQYQRSHSVHDKPVHDTLYQDTPLYGHQPHTPYSMQPGYTQQHIRYQQHEPNITAPNAHSAKHSGHKKKHGASQQAPSGRVPQDKHYRHEHHHQHHKKRHHQHKHQQPSLIPLYVGKKGVAKSSSIAIQTKAQSEDADWEDSDIEMSSLDQDKNVKILYPRQQVPVASEPSAQLVPSVDRYQASQGQLLVRNNDDDYLSEGELTFEDSQALVSIIPEEKPMSSYQQPLQEVQLTGKLLIGDKAANIASLHRRKVYPPPTVPPKPKGKHKDRYRKQPPEVPTRKPETKLSNYGDENVNTINFWSQNNGQEPVAQGLITMTNRSKTEKVVNYPTKTVRSETVQYRRSSSGVFSYDVGDNSHVEAVPDDDQQSSSRMELRRPRKMEELFMEARYEQTLHESLEMTSPQYASNPSKFWEHQRRIRKASSNPLDSSFGSSCSSNHEYKATEGIQPEIKIDELDICDEIPTTSDFVHLDYAEISRPSTSLTHESESGSGTVSQDQIVPTIQQHTTEHEQYVQHVNNVPIRKRKQIAKDLSPSNDYKPMKKGAKMFTIADTDSSEDMDSRVEKTPLLDADDSYSSDLASDHDEVDRHGSNIQFDQQQQLSSYDPEREVDEILENTKTETYSPTSTLSRAFTRPKHGKSKQKHKILKIKNIETTKKSHQSLVTKLMTLESVQTHCNTNRIDEETASVRSGSVSSNHSSKESHKIPANNEVNVPQDCSSGDNTLALDSGVASPTDSIPLEDSSLKLDEKLHSTELFVPPRSTSSPVPQPDVSLSTVTSHSVENSYDSVLSQEIILMQASNRQAVDNVALEQPLKFADINEGEFYQEEVQGDELDEKIDDSFEDNFQDIFSTSEELDTSAVFSQDVSLSELLENETSEETTTNEMTKQEDETSKPKEESDDSPSSEDIDVMVRRNSEVLCQTELIDLIQTYTDDKQEKEQGIEEESELERDENQGSLLTVLEAYSTEDIVSDNSAIRNYKSIDTSVKELDVVLPSDQYKKEVESMKMLPSPAIDISSLPVKPTVKGASKSSENVSFTNRANIVRRSSAHSEPSPIVGKKFTNKLSIYKSTDTSIHEIDMPRAHIDDYVETKDTVKFTPSPVLSRKFDFNFAVQAADEEVDLIDEDTDELTINLIKPAEPSVEQAIDVTDNTETTLTEAESHITRKSYKKVKNTDKVASFIHIDLPASPKSEVRAPIKDPKVEIPEDCASLRSKFDEEEEKLIEELKHCDELYDVEVETVSLSKTDKQKETNTVAITTYQSSIVDQYAITEANASTSYLLEDTVDVDVTPVRRFSQTSASDLYIEPEQCASEVLDLQENMVTLPTSNVYIKPDHVPEYVHKEEELWIHDRTDINGQVDHTVVTIPVTERENIVINGDKLVDTVVEAERKKENGNQSQTLETKTITIHETKKLVTQSSLDKQLDDLLTNIEEAQAEHRIEEVTGGDLDYDDNYHEQLFAESNTRVTELSTDKVLNRDEASSVISSALTDGGMEISEDLQECLSTTSNESADMVVQAVADNRAVAKSEHDEEEVVLEEEVTEQEITFLFTWPKHLQKPIPKDTEPFREIHLRRVTRIKDIDLIVEDPEILCKERGKIVDSPKTAIKFSSDSGVKALQKSVENDEAIKVENVVYKKKTILSSEDDAEKKVEIPSSEQALDVGNNGKIRKSCCVTNV